MKTFAGYDIVEGAIYIGGAAVLFISWRDFRASRLDLRGGNIADDLAIRIAGESAIATALATDFHPWQLNLVKGTCQSSIQREKRLTGLFVGSVEAAGILSMVALFASGLWTIFGQGPLAQWIPTATSLAFCGLVLAVGWMHQRDLWMERCSTICDRALEEQKRNAVRRRRGPNRLWISGGADEPED